MKKLIFVAVTIHIFLSPVLTLQAESIEIPGTGAAEILLGKLAREFNVLNPGHTVVIPPSVGSSGGIRLVGEGENILGRVARPLKEEEKKYGLEYKIFAKDPVVFAVNRKVGVQGISRDQLFEIYSGRVKNWKEVGGRDYTVRLLTREQDDSSLLIIKKHIPLFRRLKFSSQAKILYHDSEMVEMLQKYSTAIGWLTGSSLNAISQQVVGLALDGVEPTAENVLAGHYALSGEYALVFKENDLSPLAIKFLDFLFSEKGVGILNDEGVIPVTKR